MEPITLSILGAAVLVKAGCNVVKKLANKKRVQTTLNTLVQMKGDGRMRWVPPSPPELHMESEIKLVEEARRRAEEAEAQQSPDYIVAAVAAYSAPHIAAQQARERAHYLQQMWPKEVPFPDLSQI